jgi:hypothetical protein
VTETRAHDRVVIRKSIAYGVPGQIDAFYGLSLLILTIFPGAKDDVST